MACISLKSCVRATAWIVGTLVLARGIAHGEDARYRVTFGASWSAETHPESFPSNPHFSGLVGGTHNSHVSFWEPGGAATPGIKQMAETGAQGALQAEVQNAINSGTADSVLKGFGISLSPGSTSLEFTISETFPLVTLVSMIAPSPDWFVGVHGLDLRPDGQWLGELMVELAPYDAGTDSGVVYTSPNAATVPPEMISRMLGFPFVGAPPLGTYTFLRLLNGDYNTNGIHDASDIDRLAAAIREGSSDPQFDLNGDAKVDLVDHDYWVHDLKRTSLGDANLDGRFNSTDFVAVFVVGEYEDNVTNNSGWSDGDWTGDGEFTSSDMVAAFLDGAYETEMGTVSTVPEPSVSTWMWLAIPWLAYLRRA